MNSDQPTPRVVGLTGPAGAGKDTVAHMIDEIETIRVFRFADTLKHMTRILTGQDDLDSQDAKECLFMGRSVRYVLQTLGTDWGRDMVHPDIWVETLHRRIGQTTRSWPVVIPDVRFENEASWVRANGELWHVTRPDNPHSTGATSAHDSEAGVAYLPQDKVLPNDSDLLTLKQTVRDYWTKAAQEGGDEGA
jgi:hypothetical protein